ncbi:hypothetical protein MRX96_011709 [Rhipicephalus microplus]
MKAASVVVRGLVRPHAPGIDFSASPITRTDAGNLMWPSRGPPPTEAARSPQVSSLRYAFPSLLPHYSLNLHLFVSSLYFFSCSPRASPVRSSADSRVDPRRRTADARSYVSCVTPENSGVHRAVSV